MKKQINLGDKKIYYTLKLSKRARKMRLAIYGDGNFVVTMPQRVDFSFVEKFILSKAEWVVKKMEYFKRNGGSIFTKGSKADFLKHKHNARLFIEERLEHLNSFYEFEFNRVSIRNQKTRWGSCSRKKNLNFNYKIVLLPQHLADYIIVHELCHLCELNHSKDFWNLVAKTVPNHRELRGALRKHKV